MIILVISNGYDYNTEVVKTRSYNMDLDTFLNTYVKKVYRERYKTAILSGKTVPNYDVETWSDFKKSIMSEISWCLSDFNRKAEKDHIIPLNIYDGAIQTIYLSDEPINVNRLYKVKVMDPFRETDYNPYDPYYNKNL